MIAVMLWGCAAPSSPEDADGDEVPFPRDCDDGDPAQNLCPEPRFVDVGAGAYHTCAIRGSGDAVCWGHPLYDSGQTDAPPGKFRSISAWEHVSCGIRDDFTVACWGDPAYGANGPPTDFRASQIDVGYDHSCALGFGGEITCWGSCDYTGGCPESGNGPFAEMDLGFPYLCALGFDGEPECWANYNYPSELPPGPWRHLSVGDQTICEVDEGGHVVCVGESIAANANRIPTDSDFTSVVIGYQTGCALHRDGRAVCWGEGWAGQDKAPADKVFVKLTAGHDHECGLTPEGEIVCWGDNSYEQLEVPTD